MRLPDACPREERAAAVGAWELFGACMRHVLSCGFHIQYLVNLYMRDVAARVGIVRVVDVDWCRSG